MKSIFTRIRLIYSVFLWFWFLLRSRNTDLPFIYKMSVYTNQNSGTESEEWCTLEINEETIGK